jgi:serine protease Do
MKRVHWLIGITAFTVLSAAVAQQPNPREVKVRGDKSKVEAGGFWIYNDLNRGFADAKRTGKPLLVTFRCIPCEHCAQFDERVAERDATIQKLLEQFVCVRVVHANGMDLSLFQFDYDQSWAAFFLNADRTIYGRYGTRSHRTESHNDMSLLGFAKTLQAALDLHKQYPKNKVALAAKTGKPVTPAVPEQYEHLKNKGFGATLDYQGKVVQSCIHCHQVGEAKRLVFRTAGKTIPEDVLYPYPHPKILGLEVDPGEKSTLKAVTAGSPAEKAGFKAGDEIAMLEGQPILSTADLQWVLQNTGANATLKVEVRRAGKVVPLNLALVEGWRRSDISWRATTWELRRMAAGGLVVESVSPETRRSTGLPAEGMALQVKHVGQYGAHAAGKQAGFQKDDVLVSVAGRSENMTEWELLGFLLTEKRPGDKVPVTVQRGAQKVQLMLPMQ